MTFKFAFSFHLTGPSTQVLCFLNKLCIREFKAFPPCQQILSESNNFVRLSTGKGKSLTAKCAMDSFSRLISMFDIFYVCMIRLSLELSLLSKNNKSNILNLSNDPLSVYKQTSPDLEKHHASLIFMS